MNAGQTALEEGRAAYKDGLVISENPYSPVDEPVRFGAWNGGYAAAMIDTAREADAAGKSLEDIELPPAAKPARAWADGDKIRVEWETIGGEQRKGIAKELDGNVLVVMCDDGKVHCIEDGDKIEWLGDDDARQEAE